MTVAPRAGDGGADPGHRPGAPSESVVTVVIPETTKAIGSGSPATHGASPMRISDLVRHEWDSAESGPERIREECRGVWERWAAALMGRIGHLNWTHGGFGPADVTCREGKTAGGERSWRCAVHLRCWAEYRGRLDSIAGPDRTSEVGPALAPEEWQSYAPLDRALAQHAPAVVHENPHGAAALALHGQPYGFTWDDYYELLDNAHEIEHDHGGDFMFPERRRQVDALRSIAARIAALLPPRESQGQAAHF